MGSMINITEYGGDLLPLKAVGGSYECKRWDNYLSFKSQSPGGNLQSDSTIANGNAMFNAEVFNNFLFEFLYIRSFV